MPCYVIEKGFYNILIRIWRERESGNDVAKVADVSISTILQVLNENCPVHDTQRIMRESTGPCGGFRHDLEGSPDE
jgi:hypothetical protein